MNNEVQELGKFRRNADVFWCFFSGLNDTFVLQCLNGIRDFLHNKYGPGLELLCAHWQGAQSFFRQRFVCEIDYIVFECTDENVRATFFFLFILTFDEIADYFLTQPLVSKHGFDMFRRTVLQRLADRYLRNDSMSEREFACEVRVEYVRCCGVPIP